MINPVNINNIRFTSKKDGEDGNKLKYSKDTLLKNNIGTRTRIQFDKLTNACTLYPAKGLKGSKNANFYEFLSMGTVPYLVGSGMLMAVFNSANKHFNAFDNAKASSVGKKMALGVALYGIAKSASKALVNAPVKWATGVDTEVPFAKVNYELPDSINDTDITSIEYQKAYGSVEFPRWDLFYNDKPGANRLEYYDKVAKKLGLGENLPSSDKEVKPRIKEIVTKSNAVKSLTSYLWAATGVVLACQQPWENVFNISTKSFWRNPAFKDSSKTFAQKSSEYATTLGKQIGKYTRTVGKSFVDSAKELWTGGKNAKMAGKVAGKALILTAAIATVLGDWIITSSAKKPSKLDSSDIIQKDRKYVVS